MIARAENNTPRAGGMFRALSHRNFRLFWAGALLSNAGTWMQTVAQGWLVLQLTDSPFWLGFDGFMATLPGLLLTLVGGVFADSVDRKRLLIITQVGAGLTALILAILVATRIVGDASDVWMILLISFATGCCWALAGPSYQAITFDLVGREDLANAIALNSTQFQFSRVVGPVLAGVAIQYFGLAGCFFLNALSFVAIVWALAKVNFDEQTEGGEAGTQLDAAGEHLTPVTPADGAAREMRAKKDARALWRDLLDGFYYVGGRPRVRLIILSSAVVSLFGAPYLTLMPLFARDVFGWDETGLSLLMATVGAGAFCGALTLVYLGDVRRKGLIVLVGALSAAFCLIGFALAGDYRAALAFLFGVGFSMVCFFALSNTLLQQLVTDEMRGRVMSMWILAFIGTMPLGSFMAGLSAERFGAPATLASGGVFIIAFVLLVGVRQLRRLATEREG